MAYAALGQEVGVTALLLSAAGLFVYGLIRARAAEPSALRPVGSGARRSGRKGLQQVRLTERVVAGAPGFGQGLDLASQRRAGAIARRIRSSPPTGGRGTSIPLDAAKPRPAPRPVPGPERDREGCDPG